MESVDEQTAAYSALYPSYELFAEKLKVLLCDILKSSGINVQIIEGRAKSISGFKEKIQRPGKSYKNGLIEIPDLCGCRIIAYYTDDVETISQVLKKEFVIIEEELSHQPGSLQADQFGYISVHFVLKLNQARLGLPEWAAFSAFKSEVQVRTVIQHAWSAVSHALQYKTETEIPSSLSRRLFRIAGLFELADEEFVAIRNKKIQLRESASISIASGLKNISLSLASIEQFIISWNKLDALKESAELAGLLVKESNENADVIADIYDLASRASIKTIDELEIRLSSCNFDILKTINYGQTDKEEWSVSQNFLIYLLLIAAESKHVTVDYLLGRDWSRNIAEDVIESLKA